MTPLPLDSSANSYGTVSSILSELQERFGDRVTVDETIRHEHGHDVSHHPVQPPDAVFFPRTVHEVANAVSLCAAHRVPVIPFGTGTAVEGGVVAVHRGLCIDVTKMNRILGVSMVDADAVVEAGVTRKQLNRYLEEQQTGVYFPVDPGADASLGGMAATRASGSAAVRYGTMRENVLGLTVVLAGGQIISTGGRSRKSSAGYDLTHLFVGSEGTLGIITELIVRLARIPEAASAAVCPFPSFEAAAQTAIDVIAAGIPVARLELLDDVQMKAINSYSKLNCSEASTLFFEFHGSTSSVVEQAQQAEQIARTHGGNQFQWATDEAERHQLWQARHDAYYASLALKPGGEGYVTDVCVPMSNFAECVGRTKRDLQSCSLPAPLFGHVGDGNFHVVFSIDPERPDELTEAKQFSEMMITHALDLGGTCTGEHGIGLGKREALIKERGPAVDVMRSIKRALDPQCLMNPGKVL
ncbi:MAG: FAD-binding protein [Planctomycetota bacterium]|nr:FAD-binding protein [Planctomycetota bacterium]MDA1212537.1 FAD-binding protein [Planctomycetota bacterium]